MKLYHGGVPGLRRGGVLLPPAKTGVKSSADYGADAVCRRDRVYVITDLDMARLFALFAPPKSNGDVYEVEPLSELTPDPDYRGPHESYEVELARVVRVVERRVKEWRGMDRDEALVVIEGLA